MLEIVNADVAPAALFSMHPMIHPQIARIHAVIEDHWIASIGNEFTNTRDRRGKPAIKAGQEHGESDPISLRVKILNGGQFIPGQGEWLFHQHMLSGMEGLHDQVEMSSHRRGDDNGIDAATAARITPRRNARTLTPGS